jgi:hypothetical protein
MNCPLPFVTISEDRKVKDLPMSYQPGRSKTLATIPRTVGMAAKMAKMTVGLAALLVTRLKPATIAARAAKGTAAQ